MEWVNRSFVEHSLVHHWLLRVRVSTFKEFVAYQAGEMVVYGSPYSTHSLRHPGSTEEALSAETRL